MNSKEYYLNHALVYMDTANKGGVFGASNMRGSAEYYLQRYFELIDKELDPKLFGLDAKSHVLDRSMSVKKMKGI